MPNIQDSKKRFTNTVDNYIKYRPHYPKSVLDVLTKHCNFTQNSIVADIGAGTGIFSKLLAENGNPVFGVEPNDAMREASEDYLKDYSNFHAINGSSEKTTLDNHSIDIITAAQSFHWFDRDVAKKEFQRILKPGGYVVLLWNLRQEDASPFMRAYENLLEIYGINYHEVAADNFDLTMIKDFYAPCDFSFEMVKNPIKMDLEGARGRLDSTSYVPKPGDKKYEAMIKDFNAMFEAHQENKLVEFIYETKIYHGHLDD
jgi:SAM-dependent methyltransferase